MAIIKWNALVEYASGPMGDTVYCKLRDINYTRARPKKNTSNTVLQRTNRSMFSMAVRSWQVLRAGEKEVYAKRAVDLNMSGYNLYISLYMKAGAFRINDNNAGELDAGIARSSYGHGRFGIASDSLLLRFSSASSSILPLTGFLPEPESTFSGEKRGMFPP